MNGYKNCLRILLCSGLALTVSAQQSPAPKTSVPKTPAQQPAATQPVTQPTAQQISERSTVRVKDIAEIEGVRGNQLIGYGLVIGLNRTGDKVQQNLYARQTLQNLLQRMGISTSVDTLKPENIATVLVTATLPPFVRQGSRIDVTVSSIGDSRSLQGGTLIIAPLKGVDGQVYALAQGSVSIGGISAGGSGNSVDIGHPTVGRVPNGGMVERAVAMDLAANGSLTLVLRQDDFTTSARLSRAVNEMFGTGTARSMDGRNIVVKVPTKYLDDNVSFISDLEGVRVQTDVIAKVIINERTGTIIMGSNVRLSSVAISQGGVTVKIGTEFDVSQPNPLARTGETAVTPRVDVNVQERKPESVILPDGATVEEVVRGLRAVGATARDIISILQAIKGAGALAADLELQ